MPLGQFDEFVLVDPFRFIFTVSLALHLDLEGFLVGVLSHHALQLEGISIELHYFSLSLYNIILLKILINI